MFNLKKMKRLLLIISLVLSQTSYGQSEFVFTENGLTPTSINITLENKTKGKLYQKTLTWIQQTFKKPNEVISEQSQNNFIILTDIKPNYINIKKDYYYVKYRVKIQFEKGAYTMEPLEVFTKLNSKYDMGWKPFDLKDGAALFKRGKPIKSTKAYVRKVPTLFNELNESLSKELKK